MNALFKSFSLAVALMALTSHAMAYCSEPSFFGSAPDTPGIYMKPSVPYCLKDYSFSRQHTCEEYEIDAYFNKVNEYIRKLNEYLSEAGQFAQKANEFSKGAAEYARCEAEAVKRQHE